MTVIARVEPLTSTRAVRGPFDYLLPEEMADVEVGSMLVVPFGRRRMLGVVVGLSERSEVPRERLLEPLRALELGVGADLVALAEWIARSYCSTPARALSLVLPPGVGSGPEPRVGPKLALAARLTAAGDAALAGGERLTDRQRTTLELLRERGPLPANATGVDHGALRRLERRGLLDLEQVVIRRAPRNVAVGARLAAPPALTVAQRDVLVAVEGALAAGRTRRFLLHGVTGSGKTEVYLRATAAALERGRGVIVLVPEIALTPQTVGRFSDRFGELVAVLHSGLGRGERLDEWHRLLSGEARICVGPRSAVLAPVRSLGLIVVDEEHDSSYKQDSDPRYDARAVAERRAQLGGAVLLAGSATPRPESYCSYERLRLSERVDGRALPAVEILDMRGARGPLHPQTREALAEVRRQSGKAIVMVNRRGWSNFLTCRDCGHVWQCPACDVALVLHRAAAMIACHHCGHSERVPPNCRECGSTAVARHGAGTERLEHELRAALADPGFPIVRLDSDVIAGKDQAGALLRRFDEAPAGVLIGTQMVAKGHDFPDVTLGVVLDADSTLRFPDFRAEERTFALVAQLAGRAGRGPRGGRVLVQTIAPRAPVLRLAAQHDSEGFLAGELGRRQALRYPPFARLIRVVCSAADPDAPRTAAQALRDRIEVPGATLLGPAPLFRLRGRERSQLVIKALQGEAAVAAIDAAVSGLARELRDRGVAITVDVDPQ